MNTEAGFWDRVDKSGDCWLWKGARNREGGYGRTSWQGKVRTTHRLAWEIANGRSVPEGMLVTHSCDNPPCCNPAHLSIGTQTDNMREMFDRGRKQRASRPPSPPTGQPANSSKTYCKRGHEFTAANTHVRPDGRRLCRECNRAAKQLSRQRNNPPC